MFCDMLRFLDITMDFTICRGESPRGESLPWITMFVSVSVSPDIVLSYMESDTFIKTDSSDNSQTVIYWYFDVCSNNFQAILNGNNFLSE